MKKKLPGFLAHGFLGPGLLILLGGSILALVFPKEEVFMAVHGWNSSFADGLFKVWTYLGEGWVMALGVLLVALFWRIRAGLTLLAAFVFSGLGAQFFKKVVFGKTPRPVKYFELEQLDFDFNVIEGVNMHAWYSFPSGHTATAFGVFFGLSLFLQGRWTCIPLVLALGVGYSRIYLGLHFLSDVCGGMALGIFLGGLAWWWLKRYQASWLDKSVLGLIGR